MIMTLTRSIAMPRDTDNATCHKIDLTRGIFNFFSKNLKKIKKKNHRLTRGTLTNDVSQLRLQGT